MGDWDGGEDEDGGLGRRHGMAMELGSAWDSDEDANGGLGRREMRA